MTATHAADRADAGTIITPEAVVLDFEAAGIASRAIAVTFDLLVQGGAIYGLAIVVAIVAAGSPVAAIVLFLIGLTAILLGYSVLCETLNRGRTIGGMALGLRVVTVEGGPVRFRHALIRSLLGLVDFWLSAGSVAVASALISRRGQRLGDLVAGTMVIRTRKGAEVLTARSFHVPPHLVEWSASMDTSPLGHDGYCLVRDYLDRERLTKGLGQLAPAVEAFVTSRLPLWPRPANASTVDWLTAIAYRAQLQGQPPDPDGTTTRAHAAAAVALLHNAPPPPPPGFGTAPAGLPPRPKPSVTGPRPKPPPPPPRSRGSMIPPPPEAYAPAAPPPPPPAAPHGQPPAAPPPPAPPHGQPPPAPHGQPPAPAPAPLPESAPTSSQDLDEPPADGFAVPR